MSEIIQFKKRRELGAILTDTFKFIRLTWKPLFGLILRIAGPALIVLVISAMFYTRSSTNFDTLGNTLYPASMFLWAILMFLSIMVFYALLYLTVLNFIQSYIETNGNPVRSEVIAEVRKRFWGMFGLVFLASLIIGVGLVACIVPGIYLGVPIALTYSIFVFNNQSATDSISESFKFVKNEWWITFATFLVVIILYYVIVAIFLIPQYIYFFTKNFVVNEITSVDPAELIDWTYLALNSIGTIGQYLVHIIIVISSAFVYFNLNERKNFTGTIETIDAIGNRE